jgi:adenine-specific DNA-methyltransferase
LWFAKDISKIKFRKLYEEYQPQVGEVGYNWIIFPDGTSRGLTADEKRNPSKIPTDGKVYKATSIKSQGATSSPQEFEFKGKKYYPGSSHHWKTSVEGLQRLAEKNRIHLAANSIQYIRYNDDFPYKQLTNIWLDTGTGSFRR